MKSPGGAQRCSCQCHWDLSWLRFGDSKISAGDVDGLFVVERTGHFLFIETKGEKEFLTQGQEILLKALSRVPRFTVIVLCGPKGSPKTLLRVQQGQWLPAEETSRDDVQRRVDAWYRTANGRA